MEDDLWVLTDSKGDSQKTRKNRRELIKRSYATTNDSPLNVTPGVSVWNLKLLCAPAAIHITAVVMWRKPVMVHLDRAASPAVYLSGDTLKSYLFHTCVCVKETTNTKIWVTK